MAARVLAAAAWRVSVLAVVRVRRAVVFVGDLAAVDALLRAVVVRFGAVLVVEVVVVAIW